MYTNKYRLGRFTEHFRQQFSEIGNTREQLHVFHAWISFHFNENVEMIDVYVNHIRQVLGYQEPQILEVFTNILPTKIILGSFSHNGLKTSGRDS